MTMPTVVIGLDLGVADAGDFIVGSSLVGGADVISDGLTTVTGSSTRVSIRRGRTGRLIDPIDAASVVITLNNEDRSFDPAFSTGPYFGALVPARGVSVTVGGVRIFTGFIEDWDLDYDVSGRSTASVKGTDALGILGQCEFDAWTNTYTTPASKLFAICDRTEVQWPSPLRWFDDAITPSLSADLQSDSVSWGSSVLAYCQQIAKSGYFSLFFAMADGVLRYQEFAATSGPSTAFPKYPAVSASFGGANIPFRSIARRSGSETLFSSVSVDREGGTAQTSSVADPATWQTTYGRLRRLSVPSTLFADDSSSLSMSATLLGFYDEPSDDLNEISVELAALSGSDQTTVLGVDIGATVTVEFTPNGVGSAITQTLAVQGISHDISPASHVVTFSLFNYLDATV